eukprot:364701-Chlamydomonas_euryale.AAC.4
MMWMWMWEGRAGGSGRLELELQQQVAVAEMSEQCGQSWAGGCGRVAVAELSGRLWEVWEGGAGWCERPSGRLWGEEGMVGVVVECEGRRPDGRERREERGQERGERQCREQAWEEVGAGVVKRGSGKHEQWMTCYAIETHQLTSSP